LDPATISFPIFGEGFVIDPPRYISIFGLSIYLYGLFVTAGFVLAAVYLLKRREVIGLTKDNVLDLMILAVPCGLIGARIFYVLFNIEHYFGAGNWLNIFMVREGGLAVYGGVIGGAVAFFVYSRIKKVPYGKLVDAAGFGLFIGQAVGRWGNFFNREAFGVETGIPWRMGLTFERNTYIAYLGRTFEAGIPHYFHPAFLYESLWNIVGLVFMHIFSKKSRTKYYGQYFLAYVAWYGLGRYMIEGLRVDSLFIYGTGIRISQLLAALSCIAAISILIYNRERGLTSLCEQAQEAGGQEPEDESGQESDANDMD